MALGTLLGETAPRGDGAGRSVVAATAALPARAKRVIFLFMAGAPSHLELFDYKPELAKYDGKLPPAELLKGYRAAFINPNSTLAGPKFKFARHGQSGAELSELLPHLAAVADDVAIVKSMVTDAFNHAPGQIMMNTGSQQFGRPSIGAWTTYGLGSESHDLPGFVVFNSAKKGTSGGSSNWGCGFLPTVYQGVPLRSQGNLARVRLQEEMMTISGNSGTASGNLGFALGQPANVNSTVTVSGSTPLGASANVVVAVVAITGFGMNAGGQAGYAAPPSVDNGLTPNYTRTNADGSQTNVACGLSAISNVAAIVSTNVNAQSVTVSIPAMRGAVAYAWFWGVNVAAAAANVKLRCHHRLADIHDHWLASQIDGSGCNLCRKLRRLEHGQQLPADPFRRTRNLHVQ